jgi:hypothetical protein
MNLKESFDLVDRALGILIEELNHNCLSACVGDTARATCRKHGDETKDARQQFNEMAKWYKVTKKCCGYLWDPLEKGE